MAVMWHKTSFAGVRYYEHESRKHGIQRDKYFAIRHQANGVRKEEGLGWSSQGWTAQKAAMQLAKIKEGQRLGEGPQSLAEKRTFVRKAKESEAKANIPFAEFFTEHYLPHAKLSKRLGTWRVEEIHFRLWLSPLLGERPMREIDVADMEKVRHKLMEANRTKRTVQHVFSTFRLCWNHAKARSIVKIDSPTKIIRLGRIDNARVRFLTPAEVADLLAEVRATSESAFRLTAGAVYTGARLGELSALTWGNVDLAARDLTLLHTKTGKPRTVPITPQLHEILAGLPKGGPGDLVFTDAKGGAHREQPWAFRKAVRNLKLNEGREDRREWICFHSLRHTAASLLLSAGVDMTLPRRVYHP
ncbi:MAG: site-specific integrase [Proteobacteria bacterium]|nr:site-specific integrase [Pseudomonadota bacterium]MBU1594167.1 site-specific integrase [Pseudomonadota bacterium]